MPKFNFKSSLIVHVNPNMPKLALLAVGLVLTFAPLAQAQTIRVLSDNPSINAQLSEEREEQVSNARKLYTAREGLSEADWNSRMARQNLVEDIKYKRLKQFADDVNQASREHGIGTCFRGFLSGRDTMVRQDIETSTVVIVNKDKSGNIISTGSGFVARDSDTPNSPYNKVITAQHVISQADSDESFQDIKKTIELLRGLYPDRTLKEAFIEAITGNLMKFPKIKNSDDIKKYSELLDGFAKNQGKIERTEILSSTGELLGVFKVIAQAGSLSEPVRLMEDVLGLPEIANRGNTFQTPTRDFQNIKNTSSIKMSNDWAVLEVNPASVNVKYQKIKGLKLASFMSSERTHGWSGGLDHYSNRMQPGVKPGFSGGPVVDSMGYVHGVVSGAYTRPGEVIYFHDMQSALGQKGDVPMVEKQIMIANPLGDKRLLSVIGKAGIGVSESPKAPMNTGEVLTLVGSPAGFCASSPTRQVSVYEIPPLINRTTTINSPAPYGEMISRNGDRVIYDADALVSRIEKKDGQVDYFELGEKVRTEFKDNSWKEFENGHLARSGTPDGTITGYETITIRGKVQSIAKVQISPDGEELKIIDGKAIKIFGEPKP